MAIAASLLFGGIACSFRYGEQPASTLKTGDGAEYLAHEVIVKLRAGASTQALTAALTTVGGQIQPEPVAAMATLGYYRVKLPGNVSADEAISQLAGDATVAKAERSYLVHTYVTPNDSRYGELWGMTKIGAPAAWDTNTGSTEVLVAVSDTGMDYNHPDLTTNVWTNAGEIPGNGKDDDGNGYIDDIHGWDFANSDADPMDDHGHGTHVSGTIGGIGNNGVGVAGVNWRVKIQAVKFLGATGGGSMWGGAQTILYAAKMKARVVNASWGCLGPSCYASYIEDAIKTLANAGGLFVAAAGNSNNDNDAYPNYPSNYAGTNIVAVAATDSNDNLASFSNRGATRVHLGAPGVGILSAIRNGGYASWNGTSMAAPHVAGAAALFFSVRPDATFA
ncbi:MAG: S8 family serine peptidase, partial [Deltaproteobacteria bacterium]|nr:S8 family serine peptidase [Deltaproteobacteria bacterium]